MWLSMFDRQTSGGLLCLYIEKLAQAGAVEASFILLLDNHKVSCCPLL